MPGTKHSRGLTHYLASAPYRNLGCWRSVRLSRHQARCSFTVIIVQQHNIVQPFCKTHWLLSSPPSPNLQEAVLREPTVTSSLLPALEGAAEPSTTAGVSAGGAAGPAAAAGSMAPTTAAAAGKAAAGAALGAAAAGILPVAVSASDHRSYAEAAGSPEVAASLASKEAPETVGAAELAAGAAFEAQPSAAEGAVGSTAAAAAPPQRLPGAAELAAAVAAQPESLDATAEYLSERDAARSREGLGLEAAGPAAAGQAEGQLLRGASEEAAGGGAAAGGVAPLAGDEAGERLHFQVGWCLRSVNFCH